MEQNKLVLEGPKRMPINLRMDTKQNFVHLN